MLFFLLTAVPFLTGLNSPDGLAAAEQGVYICEENAGNVLMVSANGQVAVTAGGLHSPEGICVSEDGRILVTEDTESGRLLEIRGDSAVTLVSGLCCPEGVTVDSSGAVWFTTGGIQGGCFFTTLWKLFEGKVSAEYSLPSVFSFSELEAADDGMIYICSESSGILGDVAVFRFDPVSGVLTPFVTGVSACEGIGTTGGGFPFYITDESGSVYTVNSSGTAVEVISGLETIEDVAVVGNKLYISEDGSGSVLVLEIDE